MSDDFGGSSGGCDTSDTGPSWSSSDHDTGHSFSSSSHHDSGHSWSTTHHHDSSFSHSHYNDHSNHSSSLSHHSMLGWSDDPHHHHTAASSSSSPSAHSSDTLTGYTSDFTTVSDISRIGSNSGETPEQSHGTRRNIPVLEHGFSFGERSVSFQPTSPLDVNRDDDDEDNDFEDEGIGEIYGTEGREFSSSVESSPSYKPSPVVNKRQVISKPIGKVGHIGQNIGLGHQLGMLMEDVELRPKPVKLESLEYILDDDSPMQLDVKWSKPDNADRFKTLTFEIEMKPKSPSDEWLSVASVKFPVFRIYHTDDKLFIGKMHFSRQAYDLSYMLRIKSQGEVSPQTGVSLTLTSDWSKEITITFLGYETEHNTVLTTCL